jgi:hypothetical protein
LNRSEIGTGLTEFIFGTIQIVSGIAATIRSNS